MGTACVLITYLLPFGFGLQGSRIDPAARLRGWREVGQTVDVAWRHLPSAEGAFLVATTGRTAASELAFYLPAQPRAYVWNATGQILSQYDVWGGPHDRIGRGQPDRHAAGQSAARSLGNRIRNRGTGRSSQHPDWQRPQPPVSTVVRPRLSRLAVQPSGDRQSGGWRPL